MPKASSTAERVADKLTAITTAAEALSKHTSKAISLRDKVNRRTVTPASIRYGKYQVRHMSFDSVAAMRTIMKATIVSQCNSGFNSLWKMSSEACVIL
jgi:hypothetical protein